MDTSFEVSVTRENSSSDNITLTDCLVYFRLKFSGVTNADHASIASSVESELLEICLDTRFLEVLSDNSRTRTEGSLNVRLDFQSLCNSVLSK